MHERHERDLLRAKLKSIEAWMAEHRAIAYSNAAEAAMENQRDTEQYWCGVEDTLNNLRNFLEESDNGDSTGD